MEAWSGIFDAENRRITRENFITGCTDNLDNTEGAEESCGAQFDQMDGEGLGSISLKKHGDLVNDLVCIGHDVDPTYMALLANAIYANLRDKGVPTLITEADVDNLLDAFWVLVAAHEPAHIIQQSFGSVAQMKKILISALSILTFDQLPANLPHGRALNGSVPVTGLLMIFILAVLFS